MKNFYVIPILSILVVFLILAFICKPKVDSIIQLSREISAEKEKNSQLEKKRDDLVALSKRENEIRGELANIRTALPDQKNISTYIIELDDLATKSGVEVKAMQVAPGLLIESKPSIGQVANELTLNIAIEGPFEAVKTFFQRIYKAKRLINVESINTSFQNNTGLVSVVGSYKIYYKQRPQPPADASETLPTLSAQEQALYNELETFTAYGANASR
jgi:Tfp pilus assembly protein PilO